MGKHGSISKPPGPSEPLGELIAAYTKAWDLLPDVIVVEVSARHGVPVAEVRGRGRDSRSQLARRECMWRLAKLLRDWTQVGRRLGAPGEAFTHATVITAARAFERDNPDVVAAEGSLFAVAEERAA